MQNDFDYMQMLKGELYIAQDIHESNGSKKGKMLADKINHTPIENSDEIIKLEKNFLVKQEKIYTYIHHSMLITVDILILVRTFMQIWIVYF
ncbi:hypothetical protein ACLFLH_09090 [Mammaliicoccus sciuri]|uniref:hypothetical protein n=1 Tax=Mammaliicoccus sciuri TaxID=1296 RepID=UPI00397D1BD0